MTVRFFRTTVVGTDETKLSDLKTWLEANIDSQDLNISLADGTAQLFSPETGEHANKHVLVLDLYIDISVAMDKYYSMIETHSNQLDKAGIDFIRVIQFDDCSHDSSNPQPCEPTVRFEWIA